MNMNFALILVILVFVSGLLILVDKFFLRARRLRLQLGQAVKEGEAAPPVTKSPVLFEYARAFFPIFLIVLLLRSFLFEPFKIPSGSLEPTLLTGDFIFVNKYQYGLRLPVLNSKFLPISEPQVGDITVFRWPVDPSLDYVKRILGTGGDRVAYRNKQFFINGEPIPQRFVDTTTNPDAQGRPWVVEQLEETINGKTYNIYVRPDLPADDFEVVVPPGHYFAVGDNRDDSSDSRYWGFVPEENLVGKAAMIWMSWDTYAKRVRWSRIGHLIH